MADANRTTDDPLAHPEGDPDRPIITGSPPNPTPADPIDDNTAVPKPIYPHPDPGVPTAPDPDADPDPAPDPDPSDPLVLQGVPVDPLVLHGVPADPDFSEPRRPTHLGPDDYTVDDPFPSGLTEIPPVGLVGIADVSDTPLKDDYKNDYYMA